MFVVHNCVSGPDSGPLQISHPSHQKTKRDLGDKLSPWLCAALPRNLACFQTRAGGGSSWLQGTIDFTNPMLCLCLCSFRTPLLQIRRGTIDFTNPMLCLCLCSFRTFLSQIRPAHCTELSRRNARFLTVEGLPGPGPGGSKVLSCECYTVWRGMLGTTT